MQVVKMTVEIENVGGTEWRLLSVRYPAKLVVCFVLLYSNSFEVIHVSMVYRNGLTRYSATCNSVRA